MVLLQVGVIMNNKMKIIGLYMYGFFKNCIKLANYSLVFLFINISCLLLRFTNIVHMHKIKGKTPVHANI
jgi:hypothetical protein